MTARRKYKDTNENGKIDDGDELIGNLEETETGIYEMKELLYGKYIQNPGSSNRKDICRFIIRCFLLNEKGPAGR